MPKVKPKPKNTISPLGVLRLTFNLFKLENEQIFYPFIIIAFINFFILEFFYFSPRFPLSGFFNPIVSRIWGEQYLHYPMNLVLLPKMFYYAQVVIFLFISTLLTALVVDMIACINNEKAVSFKNSLQRVFPSYIYLVIYAFLSLLLFLAFNNIYGHVVHRAALIHSTSGGLFWIKKGVLYATPYLQFIYGMLVTTVLLYIPVLIILEKKKFLGAFFSNFKVLWGSFWFSFMLVFIPTLFYLPLLLMRDNIAALADATSPDFQVWLIILSVLIVTAINIFTLAAATTYYIYKKENP